jgi:hypothetical protein
MAKTPASRTPSRSYKLPNWVGVCSTCARTKDEVSFGAGRAGECNKCAKARWSVDNAVKIRAQRLYGNAQKRAKAMGWPAPDFGSLWIEKKINSKFCEVTGIKFDLEAHTTGCSHAKNPWVPSIDRIDSSAPYSKENVQLVVYMYNVCKSEFRHADVVNFCRHVAGKELEIG